MNEMGILYNIYSHSVYSTKKFNQYCKKKNPAIYNRSQNGISAHLLLSFEISFPKMMASLQNKF